MKGAGMRGMCVSHNVAYISAFSNVRVKMYSRDLICHYAGVFKRYSNARIYLDAAAATPVRLKVLHAMLPYFTESFGNAGAVHQEGRAAEAAIDAARADIASLLHVRPEGVVFTGSGTESNNIAIMGAIEKLHASGIAYEQLEILTTRIEHPSILEVCAALAQKGVRIRYIDVDEEGVVKLSSLEALLSSQTAVVALAYANSEIGVIEPVRKIARAIRAFEKAHAQNILLHVDAAQAPLWLTCALDSLMADSITLDAGKCGGPKGIGILAFRHGISFSPIIFGGGQEQGVRSGTENTPFIVGTACALRMAQEGHEKRAAQVSALRDAFIEMLLKIDGVILNGSMASRIANNVNISIPGIDSEFAVITLDREGIACSTKSACGGAKGSGSSVVRVISGEEARARSSIRFTLHEDITMQELEKTARTLSSHIAKMRIAAQKLTPQ